MPTVTTIRLARHEELASLQEIERAAGLPFAQIGMEAIARDEPPSVAALAVFQRAKRAWVQADGDDRPVAYIMVEPMDGHVHICQVSVHPDHGRKGLGRALIEHVAAWARGQGIAGLSLTTFTEVAWNGPYYERCGFRTVAASDLGPEHERLRGEEIARGLDRWPRACMHMSTIRPLPTD